jgi:adenosylcobinamide-phosphate synthase
MRSIPRSRPAASRSARSSAATPSSSTARRRPRRHREPRRIASDGVIAPLFWLVLGGLPGIALYKAVNTADSMIGHKNERHAEFGWASARLDDLLNWIPARLTALLIAGAAFWVKGRRRREGLDHGAARRQEARLAQCRLARSRPRRRARLLPGRPARYEGETTTCPLRHRPPRPRPRRHPQGLELYAMMLNLALGVTPSRSRCCSGDSVGP